MSPNFLCNSFICTKGMQIWQFFLWKVVINMLWHNNNCVSCVPVKALVNSWENCSFFFWSHLDFGCSSSSAWWMATISLTGTVWLRAVRNIPQLISTLRSNQSSGLAYVRVLIVHFIYLQVSTCWAVCIIINLFLS